jgi:hypothetical protein
MTWQALPTDNRLLYSQIGLMLVDDFTGMPPVYPVNVDLEYQDAATRWNFVERKPLISSAGIITFPGLGRSMDFATTPILRHRVLLRSDFYRPEYLRTVDGLEFDIHPYDDLNPPAVIPTHPQAALLLPNASYGLPSHVRVVRGLVQDTVGDPVVNVEVSEGTNERVLTDERGAFALPLRWPAVDAVVTLDALDHRTGRTDSININLPGDLSQGHLFTIS